MKIFSLIGALTLLYIVLDSSSVNAQILNKPTAADNPNIAGNSAWTAACASQDFNEYYVNFTWSPPLVNTDNQFILELSDANGDFTTATQLDTISDKNNIFDFDFSFALPENTRGDNYSLRVRSTSPAITGPASDPYSMYYIGYKDPILISRDRSGEIPPGGELQICNQETVVLATHNVPNYTNYEYNWFKDGVLLSERSSEITATEEGVYSVEIDYGFSCSGSANTLSNTIQISFIAPLNIAITAASNTAICSGQTVMLNANVSDANLTYTWFKDDAAITTPTMGQSTYTVDGSVNGFAGNYHVEVQGSNPCAERSNSIQVTDAGYFEVTLDQDTTLVLLPSQTRTISVSSTAGNPTYQWYRNNVELTGETSNSLAVTDAGEYFVRLTQGGACTNNQVDSPKTTVVLPDSFVLTIAYLDSYVACSNTEVNIALSKIEAVFGDNTLEVTNDILGDFGYTWQKNGATVTGETNYALLLVNPTENGSYTLQGTLESYVATSNELDVRLNSGETLEIQSNGTALCEGDPIMLSTESALTGENFAWIKDGVEIDTSNAIFEVLETGDYQLVVQQQDCPLLSNKISIVSFDDAAVTLDVEEEFLFVGGTTVTVTATGAQVYEWYNANNELVGTENTFDLTEAGSYLLIAGIDNCRVSRTFTAILRDEFEVPNVITPNGDGINDLWLLPNIYSGNPNIRVTIYSEMGAEVFRQANYQNNWPESGMLFPKQNMIFYYTIKEDGSTVKQGTITVIR